MAAGMASATVAPVTKLGPALVATMVYVVVPPGVYVATPSVLVICRSATGAGVSGSVAELLPGAGAVVPAGTVTGGLFAKLPAAGGVVVGATGKAAGAPPAPVTTVAVLPP